MNAKKPSDAKTDITADQLRSAERAVKQAYHKGATRRDALKMLAAGGLVTAAAGSVLTRAGAAYASTPKTGGHLKLAGYSTSAKDTLDPALFTYSNDYLRGTTFYDTLLEIRPDGQGSPRLAESWEAANGGARWIFNLRQGVTFHDGKSCGAEDVVYSLLRHQDPNTGSAAKALADQISSASADGSHRVVVDLNEPNADFPLLLATYHFSIVADGTTDFTTANGTGPFKLTDWQPGIRSVAERNENYFGNAYVDSIEHFAITDGNARTNALISGEVDMIVRVDTNTLGAIESSDNARVMNTPCPQFNELVMQVDVAPYDNRDFRDAIKWLFDRERLVQTSLKGYGVVANDHTFHPNSPYYNNDLEQHGLDIDRAKSLIKKAGMDGSTIELHVSEGSSGSIEMGLMLQQTAARAGLTIDLKREPSDGYWSNVWMKRAFTGSSWNAKPVDDVNLSLMFLSDAKWNESHVKSERLDSLIKEARTIVDLEKRKEVYGEVQAIIQAESGNVIPAFSDYLDGIGNHVKGIEAIPVGNMGGFNFANKAWIDS